jgi:hypothetical protein
MGQSQSQDGRKRYPDKVTLSPTELAAVLKNTFGENNPMRLALLDKIEREKASNPPIEQQSTQSTQPTQPTQPPVDMNSPEASKYLADFLNQRKPQAYGQYSDAQRKYQDYGSPQD